MSNETPIDPVLREVQEALAGLAAAPTSLSIERIAFAAGRRGAEARVRRWRAGAGVLALGLAASVTMQALPRSGGVGTAPRMEAAVDRSGALPTAPGMTAASTLPRELNKEEAGLLGRLIIGPEWAGGAVASRRRVGLPPEMAAGGGRERVPTVADPIIRGEVRARPAPASVWWLLLGVS